MTPSNVRTHQTYIKHLRAASTGKPSNFSSPETARQAQSNCACPIGMQQRMRRMRQGVRWQPDVHPDILTPANLLPSRLLHFTPSCQLPAELLALQPRATTSKCPDPLRPGSNGRRLHPDTPTPSSGPDRADCSSSSCTGHGQHAGCASSRPSGGRRGRRTSGSGSAAAGDCGASTSPPSLELLQQMIQWQQTSAQQPSIESQTPNTVIPTS